MSLGVSRKKLFQGLKFDGRTHTYSYNNQKLRGVNEFISQYKKPFDSKRMAAIVAKKRGISSKEVLKTWTGKRQLGTKTHSFMEKLFDNKVLIERMPKAVAERYRTPINNFYNDFIASRRLIAEEQEWRVFDPFFNLAGTIDWFGFDRELQTYLLIDWKTNSTFTTYSYKDKLKPPFQAYDDCLLNYYSLQLSAYRLVVERKEIAISTCWIVHFDEDENDYHIYEAVDFRDQLYVELRKETDGGF